MRDPDTLMDFAARAAEGAGRITLEHFGHAAVEFKGDGSEVTAADREAERFLRRTIADAFPEDGILGEEEGEEKDDAAEHDASAAAPSRYRWIVDPIDGTRSFGSGVPLYGVLLALELDGTPILGCCHLPALKETVVAARGAGAWVNGSAARVSRCEQLGDARVVTSGLEYWRDWGSEAGTQGWQSLLGATRFARTWGDCYGYVLIATGRGEIMADPAAGAPWDFAPMLPIIEEAGGRFTSISGEPVGSWTTALASNGVLHDAAASHWRIGTAGDRSLQTEAVLRRRKGSTES